MADVVRPAAGRVTRADAIRAVQGLLPDRAPRRIPLGIGRGVRMHLDFVGQSVLWLGLYEIELNRHLRRLARPGHRSFDCGGRDGFDALVIAQLTGSDVLSFEAEEANVRDMEANFALNDGLRPRAVHAFVGAESDPARHRVTIDETAYGADGFVPDFVKIDIEGAELDALRGAERLLRDRGPGLVIEVHSAELEDACGRLLVEHGYRPVVVHNRKVLPDYRTLPHNRWLVAAER